MARAAAWSALALAGYAATLALTNAGPALAYQHFRSVREMGAHPVAVSIVLVQLLCTAFALRYEVAPTWRAMRAYFADWQLLVFVLAMIASSAVVGHDLRRYVGELVTGSAFQVLALATTLVAVRAIPQSTLAAVRPRVDRWLGADAGDLDTPDAAIQGPRVDAFACGAAVFAVAVCLLLYVVAYSRQPHIPDEVAYLFQARTLAIGRLAVANPPVPAAFDMYLFQSDSLGWYSPVPPGWPAALALGVVIRAPWLVNPVLTGVNVLLVYLVLQTLYGMRVARLGTVLFAVSPWSLFLGMSFMPHALTLCCALLATLGVMRTRRTGAIGWSWLAGIALGILACVRQLDAMIMAGALGLWAIGLGGRRIRVGGTVGLVLSSMLATIPMLAFNRHFTGKPGVFPMMAYIDRVFGKGANDYGFGANRGMGWALDPNPGHGPVDGMINTALNTAATQVELFGWSVGSLVLVYAFVLRGRLSRADWLMLGLIVLTWFAYFLNYYSGGPEFGARYWYLMIVPGVALTARAVLTMTDQGANERVGADRAALDVRWLAAVALWSFGALCVFLPWRAVDKYRTLRGMRNDVVALSRDVGFGTSLVLINGPSFPDYASAAVHNPLDVRADTTVYARRTSAAVDSAVIAAYADRPIFLVDGPSQTGSAYTLRAGPLSAAEALTRISPAAR